MRGPGRVGLDRYEGPGHGELSASENVASARPFGLGCSTSRLIHCKDFGTSVWNLESLSSEPRGLCARDSTRSRHCKRSSGLSIWGKIVTRTRRGGRNRGQTARDVALAASFVRSLETDDAAANDELRQLALDLERIAEDLAQVPSQRRRGDIINRLN